MVIIKSRRVGTTTSITTTTKELRTDTDRCSTRGETVWGGKASKREGKSW